MSESEVNSPGVKKAADLFGEIETLLGDAEKKLNELAGVYAEIQQEANSPLGYLEAQLIAARTRALIGPVSLARSAVFAEHNTQTARAQELGIDLPVPPGAIRPLGGGGR